MKKHITAAAAILCMLTACSQNPDTGSTIQTSVTPSETEITTIISGGAPMQDHPDEEDPEDTVSIYTGREVADPADLAIHKFNCELPEGYEVKIDDDEGKLFVSERSSITVKAQNYKEEFMELSKFADQACANVKIGNMMSQADTVFSEPMETKVAGFDAIRYDYDVTAYIFLYETDADGNQKLDDEGKPILTDQKEVYGKFHDRIYFFYSDEDAFIITMESPDSEKDNVAEEFDRFIENVTITPPKE